MCANIWEPGLSQVHPKPQFVYNTWYPFRTFVNDSLVRDIARAAAECGIQEFIMDDGWQVNDSGKNFRQILGRKLW